MDLSDTRKEEMAVKEFLLETQDYSLILISYIKLDW